MPGSLTEMQKEAQLKLRWGHCRAALAWLLLLPALVAPVLALAAPSVDQLRLWRSPDSTRLVFDLSDGIQHSLFELQNPARIVLDLDPVDFRADLSRIDLSNTPVSGIRTGKRPDGGLRLVLDMRTEARPRSFSLEPNDSVGHRLVLDLFDRASQGGEVARAMEEFVGTNRDIIIAIDPGHGGEDPGALGPGRVREKDLVMQMARTLKRQIDATPGYSAVLVRTGDYYVSLRDRSEIARSKRADLFLSIHADAFHQPGAHGASVYALSQRGATSETAAYLAQRENRADLMGGVGELSLRDKDPTLASVLLDLSMTATLDSSLRVGNEVVRELGGVTRLHKRQVEQASFMVLKSPDMPSLLIETGFISNPDEARRLADPVFQESMASAILRGVRRYFESYPPEGTMLAQQKSSSPRTYVIQRGDTLSQIAERFGVSMAVLQQQNNLSGTVIRVGQTLQIPTS